MVKTHNCLVHIYNYTKSTMTYVGDWYDSGRVADDFSWPEKIEPDQLFQVLSYEKDWAWAGCSGYVTYKMSDTGTNITIAFSNPSSGTNKLGVGTGGKKVWDDMENHNYEEFTIKIGHQRFDCKCTDGATNACIVTARRM